MTTQGTSNQRSRRSHDHSQGRESKDYDRHINPPERLSRTTGSRRASRDSSKPEDRGGAYHVGNRCGTGDSDNRHERQSGSRQSAPYDLNCHASPWISSWDIQITSIHRINPHVCPPLFDRSLPDYQEFQRIYQRGRDYHDRHPTGRENYSVFKTPQVPGGRNPSAHTQDKPKRVHFVDEPWIGSSRQGDQTYHSTRPSHRSAAGPSIPTRRSSHRSASDSNEPIQRSSHRSATDA